MIQLIKSIYSKILKQRYSKISWQSRTESQSQHHVSQSQHHNHSITFHNHSITIMLYYVHDRSVSVCTGKSAVDIFFYHDWFILSQCVSIELRSWTRCVCDSMWLSVIVCCECETASRCTITASRFTLTRLRKHMLTFECPCTAACKCKCYVNAILLMSLSLTIKVRCTIQKVGIARNGQ